MLNAGTLSVFFVGYLLGSLPFGYLVARARGVDIFKAGSGNPGATNVKRVLGAKAGHLVFALDTLKGAAAAAWPLGMAWLTIHYSKALAGFELAGRADEIVEIWHEARLQALVCLGAAVLGHAYSVFTNFKGGKGVATTAGGLVVLMPVSCAVGAGVWGLAFLATRYVSLASILAAIAVPAASWLRGNPLPLNIAATLLGLFVILRHRSNIQRLLNGTENKFVKQPAAPP
jgi:glycerol-3-phosphate acyltransferase PlsY